MAKVLVTGATGFVGKNLVSVLRRRYQVVGIGSANWDLCQQAECESMLREVNPDVVVHAAGAVGGILANQQNPGKFLYENLIMGAHLIHLSRTHNIPKFIMIGTVCSYPKFTPVPFSESELWSGYPEETNTPYGIAKKTLMKMVETYHEQYGFCGVNLIPVNMYGPHDHFNLTSSHVIPALILKVKQALDAGSRSITIWGTGKASREFLFAPDFARAVELAIEKQISPCPINIGSGKEVPIAELVALICKIMNFDGELVYDRSKPDGQPRRCPDISRAREELGFEAETDLEEGLRQTIDWYFHHAGNDHYSSR